MALRNVIDWLASTTPATALRGVGEGVSMGLTRYPAAGISYLASKAAGYDPQFKDVLSSIRQQEQQLQQEQPIAYGGGKIAGALATVPMTGVPAVIPAIARGSLFGGISGFTQNEGMENVGRDVGLGATLGGVLSGAGAAVSKLGEKFIKKAAINRLDEHANESALTVKNAVNQLKPEIKQLTPNLKSDAERRAALETIAQNKSGRYTPEDQQLAADALTAAGNFATATKLKDLLMPLRGEGLRRTVQNQLEFSAKEAAKDAGKIALQTGLGAAGGYGTGYGLGVLGNAAGLTEMTPQQMADYGFMLGGGARLASQAMKVKQAGAAALAAKIPTYAGETAGRAITIASQPRINPLGRQTPVSSSPTQPETAGGVAEADQIFENALRAQQASSQQPPTEAASVQSEAPARRTRTADEIFEDALRRQK